jgi:hypothetical protein
VLPRSVIALVLLVAAATLAPLAHATNVDPSWGGLYDDGDFDDVILYITSAVAVADAQPLRDAGSVHDVAALLVDEPVVVVVAVPLSFSRPRGPPDPPTRVS